MTHKQQIERTRNRIACVGLLCLCALGGLAYALHPVAGAFIVMVLFPVLAIWQLQKVVCPFC